MKTKYLTATFMVVACSVKVFACKIIITYDENGYRITRSVECPRPGNNADSVKNPLVSNDSTALSDSLRNQLAGKFEVFPNPSNNIVNIRLDAISLKERCSYVLTDATGKTLEMRVITGSVTTLALSSYADGTYFIILKRGAQLNTIKIAKQYGDGSR